MRNILEGLEVINLMPTNIPKSIKRNPIDRKSYTEMEVLDLGIRYVRFADTGKCKLSDNCFT